MSKSSVTNFKSSVDLSLHSLIMCKSGLVRSECRFDPRDGAKFKSRGIILALVAEDHYRKPHAKLLLTLGLMARHRKISNVFTL